MKILITGIAGFIGSHVAEKLKLTGHEVIGVDNFSPYYDVKIKEQTAQILQKQNIRIIRLDLREQETLSVLDTNFNYIFHFAAHPGLSNTSSFEDYLTNNVIATKNILDFAEKNKSLKMFVNIATSSIYGSDACFSEEKVPQPISYYGVTKLTAEQLAFLYARQNRFKACSLRLYSVYGPRERPDKLYPKLIEAAYNNVPFFLFKGSEHHLRSYTYIEDIVEGVISVLGKENKLDQEIINLGSEQENTTQRGIEIVEKLTKKKINIIVTPKRTGDQLRTNAKIQKAKSLLNYNPDTTLEEGLMKHIEWYLKNRQ